MASAGTGVKNQNRLVSYMTAPVLYRNVVSADGAVNPASPPAISLIDMTTSPRGINDLMLYINPVAGVTPTVQVWAVVDNVWYFKSTITVGAAGRPEVHLVQGLPAANIAVVVTVATGAVSLSYSQSM